MAQKPLPTDDETELRPLLAAEGINLDDYPPLLKISEICSNPKKGVRGILPLTRKPFMTAVDNGWVDGLVPLAGRSIAFRRAAILRILLFGMKSPTLQEVRELRAKRRAEKLAEFVRSRRKPEAASSETAPPIT